METKNKKTLPLTKRNYVLLLVSTAICAIGYMLMMGKGNDDPSTFNADELYSFRRITLSVITVLFGHSLMIYAIMSKKGRE